MDPISNVDRVVLILRQRLQERARAAASKEARGVAGEAQGAPLEGVQGLALVEGLGDRQLGRALIQSLLADHFGRELVNDAKFQRIIDRVTETLEADQGASELLADTVRTLRASAR